MEVTRVGRRTEGGEFVGVKGLPVCNALCIGDLWTCSLNNYYCNSSVPVQLIL